MRLVQCPWNGSDWHRGCADPPSKSSANDLVFEQQKCCAFREDRLYTGMRPAKILTGWLIHWPTPLKPCPHCYQVPAACVEIKAKRLDVWRTLHHADPTEVKRRNDAATAKMFVMLERARGQR